MGKRIVLGITGASGFIYGITALELLNRAGYEIHLVITEPAKKIQRCECGTPDSYIQSLSHKIYDINDIDAPIASGSFHTNGMLIAPCSANTMARVANGICDNLIARAADVTLKERRRLVLMVRESPVHLGHIKNMQAVTEAGGVICPPVPSFYARPTTIAEIVTQSVARALDLFDINTDIPRWGCYGE
ncbi:MAG: UbiX family flavin prenyltransferase [Deferribacteraceae bacterium]|jgi:4-hydroxy-3-polyprenylbenzoate decarboxylase|nr:UbiX family flavin prenyltransferase [Deferribacteraceae bacterium]